MALASPDELRLHAHRDEALPRLLDAPLTPPCLLFLY